MRYHEKLEEFNFYWYIIQALLGRRPWIEIKHLVNLKNASVWGMQKSVKNSLSLNTESEAANRLFQNVAKPGSE